MGATAMGCVGGGVSVRWGVMAIERDGWGLAAMAATAMGRVGDGASARWAVTAIERNGWGNSGLFGACGSRKT
jgi:hypothetical protein